MNDERCGVATLEPRRSCRDDSLSARFARRDPQAMEEVYGRHAPGLFTTAYRVLGDRDLAAEAVQRTMLQAWQHADTYDQRRPLEPWLHAICRRAAIDTHRSHRRHPQPVRGEDLDRRLPIVTDESADVSTVEDVRRAIASLPEQERDVMRLAHLDGLTYAEVAAVLGVPVGTVKSRTHRAHRRLAARLGHLRDRT